APIAVTQLDASERRFEGWAFLGVLAPSYLAILLFLVLLVGLRAGDAFPTFPLLYLAIGLAFFVGLARARPLLVLLGPVVFAWLWLAVMWTRIPTFYSNAGRQWSGTLQTLEVIPLLLIGAALAVPIFSQRGRGRVIV